MFDEEPMILADDNEEELDIYAALGLNTPIEPTVPSNTAQSGFNIDPSDPLVFQRQYWQPRVFAALPAMR